MASQQQIDITPPSGQIITHNTYYHGPVHNIGQALNANFGANYGTISHSTSRNINHGPHPLLLPVPDASHTRNRRTSPPDSACLPGTRRDALKKIRSWASNDNLTANNHVFWLCGPVGCGKSAISQAIAEEFEAKGLLLGSFFFFRGSGDRSRIARLVVTLASQMVDAIPQTAPFVRSAVGRTFGLHGASLETQLRELVYRPLEAVTTSGQEDEDGPAPLVNCIPCEHWWGTICKPLQALFGRPHSPVTMSRPRGPYLAILDGLDECEDRAEVGDLIDGILHFFRQNPHVPLRFLIASRIEEHIRPRIEKDEVHIENLFYSRRAFADIVTLIEHTFQKAAKEDRVIRSYGAYWPRIQDVYALARHADRSFIFITTLLKFILHGESSTQSDGMTPMERFHLALMLDTGLDGLYQNLLQRAKHIPHFSEVVLTIAELIETFSILSLSQLLDIPPFKVVNVLVPLQSIIHVPSDDHETPVIVWHTSLRDYILDRERSESIFSSPERDNAHKRLTYGCFRICMDEWLDRCAQSGNRRREVLVYAEQDLPCLWRRLPPPMSSDLEFIASTVGNRLASAPHLQILYNAYSSFNSRPCGTSASFKQMFPSARSFDDALHVWRLLESGILEESLRPYYLAMFERPLPQPDPLLHRCIVMHLMRAIFDSHPFDATFTVIALSFIHHLSEGVCSTDEEDNDDVLAFLRAPYGAGELPPPVRYFVLHPAHGDHRCKGAEDLLENIHAKFPELGVVHPIALMVSEAGEDEYGLLYPTLRLHADWDKPLTGLSVLDMLNVFRAMEHLHSPEGKPILDFF